MEEDMTSKNKAEKECERKEDGSWANKLSKSEESSENRLSEDGVNEKSSVPELESEATSEKAKDERGDTSDWNDESTQASPHSLASSLLYDKWSGAMVEEGRDEGLGADGDTQESPSF